MTSSNFSPSGQPHVRPASQAPVEHFLISNRENIFRLVAESNARITQEAIEHADEWLAAALKRSSEPTLIAAFMQTVAINRAAGIIAAAIESASSNEAMP